MVDLWEEITSFVSIDELTIQLTLHVYALVIFFEFNLDTQTSCNLYKITNRSGSC